MQNKIKKIRKNNHSVFNLVSKSVKQLALTSLLLPVLSFSSFAEQATDSKIAVSAQQNGLAKQQLMAKLSKLAFFSADFSQKILSSQGELLKQGAGSLAISKPNLINWKTTSPDETMIISDGNTLWFYDPFIEQANAYSLAKSIHNTPILLLTSDEPALWQQYQVTQEQQRFIITPTDKSSQIKRLTLGFNGVNAQLNEFSFEDATGQVSQISLHNFNSKDKPDTAMFTFTLPEGIRLEDQR